MRGATTPRTTMQAVTPEAAILPRRAKTPQLRAASLSAGVGIKMPPVYLEADLSVGEAFKVIVEACLGHLAANRAMFAKPGIEAVHQMRGRFADCAVHGP